MKQLKNKIFIRTLLSLIATFSLIIVPMSASALSLNSSSYFSTTSSGQAACGALSTLSNNTQNCDSTSSDTVNNLISTIIGVMSIIVGIIAVIMIIVSGLRFITSGGDAQKVSAAKTALIYALIGLVVVALSQAIIHFVINTSTTSIAQPKHKPKSS